MSFDVFIKIKEVRLRKCIFRTQQIIDERFEKSYDHGEILHKIEIYILGESLKIYNRHIEYPKDWLQAIKNRFFPKWLKQWYPIKNDCFDLKVDIKALYPELSARVSLPEEQHIFIIQKEENEGIYIGQKEKTT